MILYLFPSYSLERYIQVAVQLIFLVIGIYFISKESPSNNDPESSGEPDTWRLKGGLLLATRYKQADHQRTENIQNDNTFVVCALLTGISCFVFWVMKNIIKDIYEFRQVKYGKDKEY